MDYKKLTEITDAEVKRSLGGTFTPGILQEQPSKDVYQRVRDFYRKVTGNASTFGSIINIGSKRVKGGQYAVIEFTPPPIEAAGDELVFKGTYEKDGMIFLCYHPQSGDWKKANEAKQEDIDEEIANSDGLLAQANAAEAENPEEQTAQSEEQETVEESPRSENAPRSNMAVNTSSAAEIEQLFNKAGMHINVNSDGSWYVSKGKINPIKVAEPEPVEEEQQSEPEQQAEEQRYEPQPEPEQQEPEQQEEEKPSKQFKPQTFYAVYMANEGGTPVDDLKEQQKDSSLIKIVTTSPTTADVHLLPNLGKTRYDYAFNNFVEVVKGNTTSYTDVKEVEPGKMELSDYNDVWKLTKKIKVSLS